jgi:hypothetical protein
LVFETSLLFTLQISALFQALDFVVILLSLSSLVLAQKQRLQARQQGRLWAGKLERNLVR